MKDAKVTEATTEGIICPSMFPLRGLQGNKHLTKITKVNTIAQRIGKLASSTSFIILPGSIGTLTEFVYVWNQSVLTGKDLTILAFRSPWEATCKSIASHLGMDQ